MEVANPLIKHSLVNTINSKRALGVADEQIAYMLNLSPAQVQAIPYPKPNIPNSRSVQHMQLRTMVQALMPAVEKGDRDAMLTMLKVQKREADLLGLDAPKEVISHNFNAHMDIDGLSDDQLREMPTEVLKRRLLNMAAQGNIIDVEANLPDPDTPSPES